jgi:hypothetical protein
VEGDPSVPTVSTLDSFSTARHNPNATIFGHKKKMINSPSTVLIKYLKYDNGKKEGNQG